MERTADGEYTKGSRAGRVGEAVEALDDWFLRLMVTRFDRGGSGGMVGESTV
jgi:hypothetical protein